MSQQQREALDALLRDAPLDLGGDVIEQRQIFEQMMQQSPVPDDVTTTPGALGGVPVVQIEVPGTDPTHVILYIHGGAYAIGSASLSVGLAADLARRAGARAVSVDYRLAPENPYPTGLEDVLDAYSSLVEHGPASTRIAIAGESAGGGLVLATLLSLTAARSRLPTAALVMSPWADLSLSGASVTTKAAVDPALTTDGLRRRAGDYAGATDLFDPRVSPLYGDLTGLPPLLIQAGSREILLDDATRLATRAAHADVEVTLDITPDVPHVFQGFAAILDEADAALTRAGRFLGAHLG